VDSTSSRCSLLQSAAYGGLPHLIFPLLATRCVRLKTIGHVIIFNNSFMFLALFLVFTESTHVCNLIPAHMCLCIRVCP
jgi:hypothetical protein